MAKTVARGEIWLYEFSRPDKRRPVVVLSRPRAISLLRTVLVAPVTSTLRGAPSEVTVGVDEGLKHDSAVNLDHVQCVAREKLTRYVGVVSRDKMRAICSALAIAVGCDG